jgi:bifunctional DNA-binding transcriptional regulator/antitoxin component of YhaV-PrlF toxin-antitoxin module
MLTSEITGDGRTVVPEAVVRQLGLKAGGELRYEERDGEIVLHPHHRVEELAGCLRSQIRRTTGDDFAVARDGARDAWL